jgi:starch phosphorylase
LTHGSSVAAFTRWAPDLPERISRLREFALDLSWSWKREVRAVFRTLDPTLWRLTRHNPVQLLREIDPVLLQSCSEDPDFLRLYDRAVAAFDAEKTDDHTWYARNYPELRGRPIAYFCAEFGLHHTVPIYSGGLGVLAGDHCKSASDLGVPLVGVGLLYTRGYFDQALTLEGWQTDADETFDISQTPLELVRGKSGEPYLTRLFSSGRKVYVAAWRLQVGRVPIYLLDTDLPDNDPADRELSHKLYAGGVDHRLKQEGLLGIGGVRVLEALGIEPVAWHANEGHAAFMMVERVRRLGQSGVPFDEAVRRVRANSVFTTHTPVPAGHDFFTHDQIKEWAGPYWDKIGNREELLGLGRHPTLDGKHFHMTAAAIRLSARVNGVSRRHGDVTRDIWRGLWNGRSVEKIPIGHVTNGVHLGTWMNFRIMRLFDHHLGPDWHENVDEPGFWDGVLWLRDRDLWDEHYKLKNRLLNFIREEARRHWRDQWSEASHLVGAGTLLEPQAFTIGFARRFAAYKRADLLFRDRERLLRILSNPWRPVQIVFAGKAHPQDELGKKVLQRVYSHTRHPAFAGRVAFVEDYGMLVAHRIVEGVDLWLNLPRPPLEASGTSGMKAGLNGVPQLGTDDGWWSEAYTGENGWSLPLADSSDPDANDATDAWNLYDLLENEIVPLFFERDERGIPTRWVRVMKNAIKVAGERFTSRRMVEEYVRNYYVPAAHGEAADTDAPGL